MTKGTKIALISIIAIFVAGAIGGWTWIMKDKERARIEAEETAAIEAAKLAEVPSSEPEKKVYNTPKIQPSSKAPDSSVASQEPLESEKPETDGQNTGDASKPDLEPPPPPESSEVSKPETVSKPAASSSTASSSVVSNEEKPASSKASGNTPKMGDTKTVDGKTYIYVDGFGWTPSTGGKSTDVDIVITGEKVGQMG